ncbi:MAG TPA: DUF3368 domain-containing protein [Tepidisphaeraceae bacterium]|jgi:hypothetical protein
MAVVVSDTSPIRTLNHVGQLDLLSHLFNEVLIPPAVRDELTRPRSRFKAISIDAIAGARLQIPSDTEKVQQLRNELQAGEAEAIALASELKVDLLIDEIAGRAIAMRMGIHVTGVVGILVEAKKRNLIPAVIPRLNRLHNELGFFLTDKLINDIRRDLKE